MTSNIRSTHTKVFHLLHPTCPCLTPAQKIASVALCVSSLGIAPLGCYLWTKFHKQGVTQPTDLDPRLMELCFDKSELSSSSQKALPDDLENEFQESGASEKNAFFRKKFIEWKNSQYQDAHHWIKFLDDKLTFPTRVLDMTLEQGLALRALYQHRVNGRASPEPKLQSALTQLEKRIDAVVNEFSASGEKVGIFVRLSTRSPKDALYYPGTENYNKMVTLLADRIKTIDPDCSEKDRANQELIIFTETMTQALQVTSGKAAIDLLANSERILTDLNRALDFPNLWDMKLIVRLFQPIPYSMEFRGFVHNKKLTALSQYDPYICFEELNSSKTQRRIIRKIETFFNEQVMERVPYDHYIVDFGIRNLKSKNAEVVVVEINSFEPSTGPALFSWEHDLDLLKGESDEVVLRVVPSVEEAAPCPFSEVTELLKKVK